MAAPLRTPVMGGGHNPGAIVQWYADDGVDVEAGDPVFCFETEYVAVEVEAEESGRLHRCFPPGTQALPGNVVALILEPGEHVPEHDEDPMAVEAVTEPPQAGAEAGDVEAGEDDEPPAPILLPLRRGGLQPAPTATPGGAWERAFGGNSGHDYRGFWPLRDEVPGEAVDGAEASPQPAADVDSGPPSDGPQTSEFRAAGIEVIDDLEEADYARWDGAPSTEEAADYLEAAPAPFVPTVVESQPAPVAATQTYTAEAWPDAALPYIAPAPVVLRGTVRLTELRKLCDQLGREWRDTSPAPANSDLVLRAVARATRENDAVASIGDSAGLVVPAPGVDGLCVLEGAAGGSLKEKVAALGRGRDAAAQPPCSFTVVSFADFGIDDATPVLPEGHPFAFAMGATRASSEAEDGVPMPLMTLTLSYAPDRMTQGDAATLFARVRDLIEAPYALLAD